MENSLYFVYVYIVFKDILHLIEHVAQDLRVCWRLVKNHYDFARACIHFHAE